MLRIALLMLFAALAGGSCVAEVLQTERACAYPVAHTPDPDVAAEDLNRPGYLPPAWIEVGQDREGPGGWFFTITAAVIRIDLQTGEVSGLADPAAAPHEPTCD